MREEDRGEIAPKSTACVPYSKRRLWRQGYVFPLLRFHNIACFYVSCARCAATHPPRLTFTASPSTYALV